jgi:hypothetical protein
LDGYFVFPHVWCSHNPKALEIWGFFPLSSQVREEYKVEERGLFLVFHILLSHPFLPLLKENQKQPKFWVMAAQNMGKQPSKMAISTHSMKNILKLLYRALRGLFYLAVLSGNVAW